MRIKMLPYQVNDKEALVLYETNTDTKIKS